jgi:predicted kinase
MNGMSKIMPSQPLFVMLYGYPGAGKTYFSRQFTQKVLAAHLEGDRIRSELFENPSYSKQENSIVEHLMNYMAGEFLSAGVSVVYDTNALRVSQRRILRDMAKSVNAVPLVVWFQMDPETAYFRNKNRDASKPDDRYAPVYDSAQFQTLLTYMQNPEPVEEYAVVSGRHIFQTQLSAVMKKLYDLGAIRPQEVANGLAKPGLVNLVPQPPPKTPGSKRNIVLR